MLITKRALKGLPVQDSVQIQCTSGHRPILFSEGDVYVNFQLFIMVLVFTLLTCGCTREKKTILSIQTLTTQQTPLRSYKPGIPQVSTSEVITLTGDNSVTLDQVFDDQSVSKVMLELQRLSDKLSAKDTIYLVLNTPGGSVDAGLRLISFAKALPQRVKTLSLFSASMGFQTVQGLSERLILDTGTVMSHRAKFGCQGEAEGEIESCMNWIMSMINALDAQAALRMGMTTPAYKNLIRDEYWAYGANAVRDRGVDRVVLARCGKGLNASKFSRVDTLFGSFLVEQSKCPLIPGFISAKPMDDKVTEMSKRYVNMMFTDKRGFVKEYIITNKWTQFQK